MPPKKQQHCISHEAAAGWPQHMVNCLAEMQTNGTLCDVTISAKDGNVSFHSNVLACVSRTVSSAAQNGNNNRIIQMSDVSTAVLSHVVQFVYHGHCQVPSSQLKDLSSIAERLQIDPLVSYCKQHLPSSSPFTRAVTRSKAKLKETEENENNDEIDETTDKDFCSPTSVPEEETGKTLTFSSPESSVRKSTRNRKTSLRLIEAISDSRPPSRIKRKYEPDNNFVSSPKSKRKLEENFEEEESKQEEPPILKNESMDQDDEVIKSEPKPNKRRTRKKKETSQSDNDNAIKEKAAESKNDPCNTDPGCKEENNQVISKVPEPEKQQMDQMDINNVASEVNGSDVVKKEEASSPVKEATVMRKKKRKRSKLRKKEKASIPIVTESSSSKVSESSASKNDELTNGKADINQENVSEHKPPSPKPPSPKLPSHKPPSPRPDEKKSTTAEEKGDTKAADTPNAECLQMEAPPEIESKPSESPPVKSKSEDPKTEGKAKNKSKSSKIHCCQLCTKRFRLSSGLEKHVFAVHPTVRPHKCSKCPLAFSSKKDMKNHRRDHAAAERSGETQVRNVYFKGYRCFVCNSTFPFPEELDTHRKKCTHHFTLGPLTIGDDEENTEIEAKNVALESKSDSTILKNDDKPAAAQGDVTMETVTSTAPTKSQQAEHLKPTDAKPDEQKTASHIDETIAATAQIQEDKTSQGECSNSAQNKETCPAESSTDTPVKPEMVAKQTTVGQGKVAHQTTVGQDNSEKPVTEVPIPIVVQDNCTTFNHQDSSPKVEETKLKPVVKVPTKGKVKPTKSESSINSHIIDDDSYFDDLEDCSEFIRHLSEDKFSQDSESGMLLCSSCKAEYRHRHAMERHQYGSHDRPRSYQCTKCAKLFSTRAECSRHLQDHKLAEEKGASNVENVYFKGYLCMRCLTKFQQPEELDIHKKMCRKELKICIYCGKGFKKCCTLKKHLTDVHKGDQELCTICDKLVTNLSAHKRAHSDKRYICPTCAKVFNRADNLRVHQRIHSGERPFSCSLCGERFRLKCLLKSHMKHHKRKLGQDTTIVYKIQEEVVQSNSEDSSDTQITKQITAELVPTASLSTGNTSSKVKKARRAPARKPAKKPQTSKKLPEVVEKFNTDAAPQFDKGQTYRPILPQAATTFGAQSIQTSDQQPFPIVSDAITVNSQFNCLPEPIQQSFQLPQPVVVGPAIQNTGMQSTIQNTGMQSTFMNQQTTPTSLPEINHILSPQRSQQHMSQAPLLLPSSMLPLPGMNQLGQGQQPLLQGQQTLPQGQHQLPQGQQPLLQSQQPLPQAMPPDQLKQSNLAHFDLPHSHDISQNVVTTYNEFTPMNNVDFTPESVAYNQTCSNLQPMRQETYSYASNGNLPMAMEDGNQMQHYIGQPVAKQVIFETEPAPQIPSNISVSEVPQSNTYLAL